MDGLCWAVWFRDANGNRIKLCTEHGRVVFQALRLPIDLTAPAEPIETITANALNTVPVCSTTGCGADACFQGVVSLSQWRAESLRTWGEQSLAQRLRKRSDAVFCYPSRSL